MSIARFLGIISFALALALPILVFAYRARIPSSQVRVTYILFSAVILLGTVHFIIEIPENATLFMSTVSLSLSVIVFWRFMIMRKT